MEYNKIQKIHIPIDKWDSMFIGALASAVFSFIPVSGAWGALASFKNIHQVQSFIRQPLTMTFWNHLLLIYLEHLATLKVCY